MIMASMWNWANDASATTEVGGILGAASYLGSPLLMKSVVDSTDGVSLGIKLLVDVVHNYGAALCYMVAFAEATGIRARMPGRPWGPVGHQIHLRAAPADRPLRVVVQKSR